MEPKKWIKISRENLFQHPRIHLVEDEVQLPNGATTKYLRHAPVASHSVGIIALNNKGEFLLQREYSYPPDKVLWQLPGGGMHEGETLEAAASRELSEESGYIAGACEVLGSFYTNNRRSDEKQYIVLCSQLTEMKRPGDPEEFIMSKWVSIRKLHHMIKEGEIENMNLLAALSLLLVRQGL